MDILRIATAGSVDDGKSTLIGRLLYETQSITKDKIEALEAASRRKGLNFTDLSLLTDGLIAEREQGITIDVAHIYFSTPQRKYIIADTPGHLEYTRNMVTGASNASVSIILIDSRHGVSEQTKRHYYISSLLRVEEVIVAVNKMDLVGYGQNRFEEIKSEFESAVGKSGFEGQRITFIPISSLYGENITTKSKEMPWYGGESLLSVLEGVENRRQRVGDGKMPARMGVQYVIRPKTEEFHDYRGYAGRVASGGFSVGEGVVALPGGRVSKIRSIEKFGTQLEKAVAGDSVVVTLEDDIDLSRGNMLVVAGREPEGRKALAAKVCWMGTTPMSAGKEYILQHGVNSQRTRVLSVDSVLDVEHLKESVEHSEIGLNGIGLVQIRLAGEVFADAYADNPANGAFILVDPMTNNTVGLGFVQ